MALDPVTGSIIAGAAGQIFGSIFGGRKSKPKPPPPPPPPPPPILLPLPGDVPFPEFSFLPQFLSPYETQSAYQPEYQPEFQPEYQSVSQTHSHSQRLSRGLLGSYFKKTEKKSQPTPQPQPTSQVSRGSNWADMGKGIRFLSGFHSVLTGRKRRSSGLPERGAGDDFRRGVNFGNRVLTSFKKTPDTQSQYSPKPTSQSWFGLPRMFKLSRRPSNQTPQPAPQPAPKPMPQPAPEPMPQPAPEPPPEFQPMPFPEFENPPQPPAQSEPVSQYQPQQPQVDQRLIEGQFEQMRLTSDIQQKVLAQEEQNRQYFMQNLPFVRNVLSGALEQAGFSKTGEAMPLQASPLYGQQMSLGEAQAGKVVAGMTQRGIPAEVAERVKQSMLQRTQQKALADAYTQRMQMLPMAMETAKQMQTAGIYTPTALQAMPSTLQAFSALSQSALAQQQLRQQHDLAQQQYGLSREQMQLQRGLAQQQMRLQHGLSQQQLGLSYHQLRQQYNLAQQQFGLSREQMLQQLGLSREQLLQQYALAQQQFGLSREQMRQQYGLAQQQFGLTQQEMRLRHLLAQQQMRYQGVLAQQQLLNQYQMAQYQAQHQSGLAQQQMQHQWAMAEAERQRQLFGSIGQLAGALYFGNRS